MGPGRLQQNLAATIATARVVSTPLPIAPEVHLYLISEDYPRGRLSDDEMVAIINQPAYWAFCWASGQVLARYLLDNPSLVADRTVLDFGAGSGVVGIAAALAGARRVIACDIDPMAIDAIQANSELNGVEVELLEDLDQLASDVDIAIAADVLYDRENLPLLKQLPAVASRVIVADSRMKDVCPHGYRELSRREATTIPDLDEFEEYNRVRVYEAI